MSGKFNHDSKQKDAFSDLLGSAPMAAGLGGNHSFGSKPLISNQPLQAMNSYGNHSYGSNGQGNYSKSTSVSTSAASANPKSTSVSTSSNQNPYPTIPNQNQYPIPNTSNQNWNHLNSISNQNTVRKANENAPLAKGIDFTNLDPLASQNHTTNTFVSLKPGNPIVQSFSTTQTSSGSPALNHQNTSKNATSLNFDLNFSLSNTSNTGKPSMASLAHQQKSTSMPKKDEINAQAWNQLDFLSNSNESKNTALLPEKGKQPADIFDLEFLQATATTASTTKKQESLLDNDLFGTIYNTQFKPVLGSNSNSQPPVKINDVQDTKNQTLMDDGIQTLKGMGFDHESSNVQDTKNQTLMDSIQTLKGMGFDHESSKKALQEANLDIDRAIQLLVQKNRESDSYDTKLATMTTELVNMGFDHLKAKSALVNTGLDKNAAINFLVNESSSSEYDLKLQQLSQAGFSLKESQDALKETNGDVQIAIGLLLLKNSSKQSKNKEDSSLVGAASQIGLSVFKNAKSAFTLAKKKVGQVLNHPIPSASNSTENISQEQWSKTNFRDSSLDNERSDIGNIPKEQVKNIQKPFAPKNLLSGKYSDSDDSVDQPLERQKKYLIPKAYEPEGNLVNLISVDSNVEKTNVPIPKTDPQPVQKQETVFATDQQIKISEELRGLGNDLFQKGQFGDAEEQYSKAIESLPSKHHLLVPLYNNRAACRLKNGNNRGAVSDCDIILSVSPNDIKALLRRATGYEALENWELARDDYRTIMGLDPNVKGCSVGLSRTIAALKPKSSAGPLIATSTKTDPSVKEAIDQAVQKLRDTNLANEQLESEKFATSEGVNSAVCQLSSHSLITLNRLIHGKRTRKTISELSFHL